MSAATERGRRSTAGKRLTFLTGQAAENDEAFWGHETWNDDDESGNESFHSSDEDSEVKRDEFDSDFDESESDHEAEEEAAGAAEERELRESERKKKRKNAGYMEVSAAGRSMLVKQQPMAKRTKHVKGKRVIGDGLNAGIVLNLPPAPPPGQSGSAAVTGTRIASAAPPSLGGLKPAPSTTQTSTTAVSGAPPLATVTTTAAPTAAVPVLPPKQSTARTNKSTGPTLAATRKRRTATTAYGPRDRAAKHSADQQDTYASKRSSSSPTAAKYASKNPSNSNKGLFSQEDLLLESVQETEPENLRWLLGRKRRQVEKDSKEGASSRETNEKVVEKFVSRRGYLNTISFPDMDHMPSLLQSQSSASVTVTNKSCVITGKVARYRDPKTGKGYHDATAFKELRRRLAAKEPLDQRSKPRPKKKAATITETAEQIASKNGSTAVQASDASSAVGRPVGSAATSTTASISTAAASVSGDTTTTAKQTAVTAIAVPTSSEEVTAASKSFHVQKNGNGTHTTTSVPSGEIVQPSGSSKIPSATMSLAAATGKPPHVAAPSSLPTPTSQTVQPASASPSSGATAVPANSKSCAATASTQTAATPGDGSRRSPRRRKPSAKVLENDEHEQQPASASTTTAKTTDMGDT